MWVESGQMGPLGLPYDVGVPAPVPGGRRDSRSHFFAGWGGGGFYAYCYVLTALLAPPGLLAILHAIPLAWRAGLCGL
jgi:hypothetical protein